MRSLKVSGIIHLFAVLHAVVALSCHLAGINDELVLTLLTNTFVAYAVARNMDKRFFRFLYYFFLAMMFVPFTVVMLPIAKEMGTLHLDNQLGLIILYTILGIGTNLFIAIGFRFRWKRRRASTALRPGASSGRSSSR